MRKNIIIPSELDSNIKTYCARNNIESESAFFRYAVSAFFDNTVRYEDMLLSQMKALSEKTDKLEKTIELLFKFVQKSHENMLGYHAEIPGDYKEAAMKNAKERYKRFFTFFIDSLQDESALFEQLLHNCFTGGAGEQV